MHGTYSSQSRVSCLGCGVSAQRANLTGMSFLQWGDVPTWGLLAGAIVTAWYARRAFIAQGKELAELTAEAAEQRRVNEKQVVVLELQQRDLKASLEQRVTTAAATRSAQASQVFVWTENRTKDRITTSGRDFYVSGEPDEVHTVGPSFAVYLKNTSRQPIYDVVIRTDHGGDDHLPILMPDGWAVFYRSPEMTWAAADFRDAGFALWSREGTGLLVDRGDERRSLG
jgi:hypothetical protein